MDDPVVSFVDRTFLLWAVVGLAVPFALGYAIGGTLVAGLTALLWGGAVRVFLLHHFTYSINSVCHVFGRRQFATDDESRNVFWLALPTFGEAWHNNHHAFPTSAVPRTAPLGAGSIFRGDLGPRAAGPDLGRGQDQPRAAGSRRQGRALSGRRPRQTEKLSAT